ncbi:unnamed protein product [Lactuca virosa]|uniref:Uncharacterized protein n=1 Tax=Lactuca virosa TaxID=75947 RepID=A0AAU9N225_9ASTR|nr:unnamed protein product [Lactuca virosa]
MGNDRLAITTLDSLYVQSFPSAIGVVLLLHPPDEELKVKTIGFGAESEREPKNGEEELEHRNHIRSTDNVHVAQVI